MRKGMVLVTILGTIAVLSIAGAIGTYVINQETGTTIKTGSSIKALRTAQSGVEEALIWLKNGGNTFPKTISGNINDTTYQVTVTKSGSNTEIVSTGQDGNAQRKVEVTLKGGVKYYPFAINGTFDVTQWDTAGYGGGSGAGGGGGGNTGWTEAEIAVVDISDSLSNDLEGRSDFTIYKMPSVEVPKVKDIKPYVTSIKNTLCTSTELSTDVTVTSKNDFKSATIDGEDVLVICGKNVTIQSSITINDKPVYIISEETTEMQEEIDADKDSLNIIAGDEIQIPIPIAFPENTFLYAENEINVEGLSEKGKSVNNLIIATPGTINLNKINNTGNTASTTMLWADKGISVDTIAETGGSRWTSRNYAIISDGNVTINTTAFANSKSDKSGLSSDEIIEYCDTGKIQGVSIPETYKEFFCELKKLIDTGSGGSINIISWKEY